MSSAKASTEPADALGDRDRDIVRRAHHQHLQRVVERHLRADGKPIFDGGILCARAETTSGVFIAIWWSRTAESAT